MIDGWGISCEIAYRWMSVDLTDDKSALVLVIAWCHQATSNYLSQCWPRYMSPNGVTRLRWINILLCRVYPIWYKPGSPLALFCYCYFCQPLRMGHGQHLNVKWIWMDGLYQFLWNQVLHFLPIFFRIASLALGQSYACSIDPEGYSCYGDLT